MKPARLTNLLATAIVLSGAMVFMGYVGKALLTKMPLIYLAVTGFSP